MYPEEMVKPMRAELTDAGFQELHSAEAVDAARQHMFPFPPSSPCMALFKNGELVHMLERHHIEGRPAELIAENLKDAYNEHC